MWDVKFTNGAYMQVMQNHVFCDGDVDRVVLNFTDDNSREIFLDANTGSLILSKQDVIALAKEFSLVVFERDANL